MNRTPNLGDLVDEDSRVVRGLRYGMLLVALAAAVSLIVEYGFFLTPEARGWLHLLDGVILILFIAEVIGGLGVARHRWSYFKSHIIEIGFVLAVVGEFLYLRFLQTEPGGFFDIHSRPLTKIYIVVAQVYVGLMVVVRAIRLNRVIFVLRLTPAQTVLLTFGSLIALGTLLLALPRASADGSSIGFVDALFTSTSAVCVTGLTVLDTGTQFSHAGQWIILLLFQIGGLGVMTLTTAFALMLGKGMSIRESAAMQDVLSNRNLGTVTQLLLTIVGVTIVLESIGTALLYSTWSPEYVASDQRLFVSIFHSVSGFCNAGFSTFAESLSGAQSSFLTHYVVAGLIIAGGLGFATLAEIPFGISRAVQRKAVWSRLSLQTKIVLLSTAVLLVTGTVGLYAIGTWASDGGFRDLSFLERLHHAFFQSVTARTAGFNTIDLHELGRSGTLLTIFLMFIGASPGGTGGGIKTVTLVVLLSILISLLSRRERPELMGRRLPVGVTHNAIALTFCASMVILLGVFALSLTEPSIPLYDLVFETVSAFGTVGLSLGITASLSSAGKIILCLCMFGGRVGVLTLILAIGRRRQAPPLKYPEEPVMIG